MTAAGCDLRSGTAKEEMEKFNSPQQRPSAAPTAVPEPIASEDIVTVDASQSGPSISIEGAGQNRSVNCTKYDRVAVNGDSGTITIKGACSRVMINGDKNTVTTDAVTEFVLNGSDNIVTYSRFVNGKRPNVVENQDGNTVEKTARTNNK